MRFAMRGLVLTSCLVLVATPRLAAQPEDWTQPFPAHRVIGNVYYVGSKDLAIYLVTSDKGHILINSGFEETVPLIRVGVELPQRWTSVTPV